MAIADMFLKLETARMGVVKGEAGDATHKGEIDVVGWSWGMHGKTATANGAATGRATVRELEIFKKIDSASTALMSAMRNNELVKKAVLTVRKAGTQPALEYLKITLQDGRITSLDVQTEGQEVSEKVSLAFRRITVEYTPQGQDGHARGGTSFETEIT